MEEKGRDGEMKGAQVGQKDGEGVSRRKHTGGGGHAVVGVVGW